MFSFKLTMRQIWKKKIQFTHKTKNGMSNTLVSGHRIHHFCVVRNCGLRKEDVLNVFLPQSGNYLCEFNEKKWLLRTIKKRFFTLLTHRQFSKVIVFYPEAKRSLHIHMIFQEVFSTLELESHNQKKKVTFLFSKNHQSCCFWRTLKMSWLFFWNTGKFA